MKRVPLSIPEIALIAGTRGALGLGVGLLAADALSRERRKGLGWALVGVGVVSTIPILFELAGWMRSHPSRGEDSGADPADATEGVSHA